VDNDGVDNGLTRPHCSVRDCERSNDVKRLTALFLAIAVAAATPAAAVDCDGQDDGEPCGKPEQRAERGDRADRDDGDDGDRDAKDDCEDALGGI